MKNIYLILLMLLSIGCGNVIAPTRACDTIPVFWEGEPILILDENGEPSINEPCIIPVYIPDDPMFPWKWDLFCIDAPTAWDSIYLNELQPVTVVVIDTGVQQDHPDMLGSVLPGITIMTWGYGETGDGSQPYGNGLDDDEDGMIDENVGHGTHVAGAIAETANNQIGACGIGGNVSILPIRVYPSDGDHDASIKDVASAIEYAADYPGVRIINLSLGTHYNSYYLSDAIEYALSKNVIVVAAAGNNGSSVPFYPAAYDGVIAVAAWMSLDGEQQPWPKSNFGGWVDCIAPGCGIWSPKFPSGYQAPSGTSLASPCVVGILAILMSYDEEWTNEHCTQALFLGCTPYPPLVPSPGPEPTPYEIRTYGAGLVNLLDSFEYAL